MTYQFSLIWLNSILFGAIQAAYWCVVLVIDFNEDSITFLALVVWLLESYLGLLFLKETHA